MVYMWRLQQEKITNELFYLISLYVVSNAKEHDLQDQNIEYQLYYLHLSKIDASVYHYQ